MNAEKLPAWLREPLLHFAVVGALLFGIDHYLVGRETDPRLIVVDAAVDQEAIAVWKASRGRDPDKAELDALRRVWLQNEVLYREGISMGVDKGDQAMRDRVIFKALSVVDANVRLPEPDEATLIKWFEAHRDKYDEPLRISFQEAVLDGDNSEKAVRDFVAQLNKGVRGDVKAGLRVFKDRPEINIKQTYGEDFFKSLQTVPSNRWQAMQTKDAWRAIWVDAVTPARAADFAAIRDPVIQDWRDDTATQQRTAAVDELIAKYKVRYSKSAP